jgi:hypothetical protein
MGISEERIAQSADFIKQHMEENQAAETVYVNADEMGSTGRSKTNGRNTDPLQSLPNSQKPKLHDDSQRVPLLLPTELAKHEAAIREATRSEATRREARTARRIARAAKWQAGAAAHEPQSDVKALPETPTDKRPGTPIPQVPTQKTLESPRRESIQAHHQKREAAAAAHEPWSEVSAGAEGDQGKPPVIKSAYLLGLLSAEAGTALSRFSMALLSTLHRPSRGRDLPARRGSATPR